MEAGCPAWLPGPAGCSRILVDVVGHAAALGAPPSVADAVSVTAVPVVNGEGGAALRSRLSGWSSRSRRACREGCRTSSSRRRRARPLVLLPRCRLHIPRASSRRRWWPVRAEGRGPGSSPSVYDFHFAAGRSFALFTVNLGVDFLGARRVGVEAIDHLLADLRFRFVRLPRWRYRSRPLGFPGSDVLPGLRASVGERGFDQVGAASVDRRVTGLGLQREVRVLARLQRFGEGHGARV